MRKYRANLLMGCASTMLFGVGAPALAQTTASAEAPALAEVVVTAQRRGAQQVIDVAASVDAYSGQDVARMNIQSIEGLSKLNPSLSIQRYGADQNQMIVRGISSSTGKTSSVYLDEAPLQGGFNANVLGDNTPVVALHDLSTVEVLKGPQGTLFGAGSMSGTLRLITNKPNYQDYEGRVEARAATVKTGNAYYDGNAMLNIPLLQDTLALRVVAWAEEGGGFIDQIPVNGLLYKNVNDIHMQGGRVALGWKPNDRFTLDASINRQVTKIDGTQGWTLSVGSVVARNGPRLGPFSPYISRAYTLEPYRSEYTLYTVTGQYDLGFGMIVASTSYGDSIRKQQNDASPSDCRFNLCSNTPAFPANFSINKQFNDYTGEIRFVSKFPGPVQITAGVYLEDDEQLYNQMQTSASRLTGTIPCTTYEECRGLGLQVPGFGQSVIQFATESLFKVQQRAIFSELAWKIQDNLTLTLGGRYFTATLSDVSKTKQNIAPGQTPNGFDGGYFQGNITTPYVSSIVSGDNSAPTFNAALLWEVNPNLSAYVRAASGFRIGGANASAIIAQQGGVSIPTVFEPDKLINYEAGVKGYFYDRQLFIDLSVYRVDWTDQQVRALAGIFNYIANAGGSRTLGVEFSSTFRPTRELTFSGNVTYVDAVLSEDLPARVVASGTPGKEGDPLPFTPKLSVSGWVQYEREISDRFTGYAQANVKYRSESRNTFRRMTAAELAAGGNNYYLDLPSYWLLDAKVGLRFDRYDVGVYVQNLTDENAYLGAQSNVDNTRIFAAPPRTVGVNVSARF